MTTGHSDSYTETTDFLHRQELAPYRMMMKCNPFLGNDLTALGVYGLFCKSYAEELLSFQLKEMQKTQQMSVIRPYNTVAGDNAAIENMVSLAAIFLQMVFIEEMPRTFNGMYDEIIKATYKKKDISYPDYFAYRMPLNGDSLFHVAVSLYAHICKSKNMLPDMDKMEMLMMELGSIYIDPKCITNIYNLYGFSVKNYITDTKDLYNYKHETTGKKRTGGITAD